MNTTNTNTNNVENTNTNEQESDMNPNIEVNINEEQTMENEISKDMKQQQALLEKLAKESAKQAEAIKQKLALMHALAKAKTQGERDAAIAALAEKFAKITVKTVKAVEKGTVIGTGITLQYSGVALKATSEQGVKLGAVMEAKGKQWANSYKEQAIIDARTWAAHEAAKKNNK